MISVFTLASCEEISDLIGNSTVDPSGDINDPSDDPTKEDKDSNSSQAGDQGSKGDNDSDAAIKVEQDSASSKYDYDSNGLEYEYKLLKGGYVLCGLGRHHGGEVIIPEKVNNKPVVEIAAYAFSGETSITGVYVPDTVKKIGHHAFEQCTSLYSLTIGTKDSKLEKIENSILFATNVTNVIYKGTMQEWLAIDVPDKAIELSWNYNRGHEVTVECEDGKLIYFSTDPTVDPTIVPNKPNEPTIPDEPTTPTVPESDPYSEGLEFTLNSDGKSYSVTGSSACTATSVVIPAKYNGKPVTGIGESAFDYHNLVEVTIPSSVTTIGDYAFSSCPNLKTVEISKNVTVIGYRAFHDCVSLKSINVNTNNTNYKSSNGVLYTKDGTELILYPMAKTLTTFAIPSGVKNISNWAFYKCSNLVNVTFPSGLERIGYGSFEYCYGLVSLEFPDSLKDIGYWTFGFCNNIISVKLPNGLEEIGGRAFSNCTSITTMFVPDSVTRIGNNAFWGCSNLDNITLPKGLTSIGDGAFDKCYALSSIYFKGNANDWSKVTIGLYNSYLYDATLYYYSANKPTSSGNYWYYNTKGKVTVW